MKNVLIFFSIVFIGALLCSCNQYSGNSPQYRLMEMIHVGEKVFELDSITLPSSKSFQFYEDENKRYITFINHEKNILYGYNYDSCNIEFAIKSADSSFRYNKINGHFIKNLDSIYFFNYQSAILHLYDLSGKLINKYQIKRDITKALYPPATLIGTFNPMVILDSFNLMHRLYFW